MKKKEIIREKVEKTGYSQKWILLAVGKGTVQGCLIARLFYQSMWGLLFVPVGIVIALHREKKEIKQKELRKEQQLFAEYLGFLKEALQVGYSLEQAVGEAKKGLLTTEKKNSPFLEAITRLQRKMQLGMPVEEAFGEWAKEAKCEDVRDFSEVLFIAKRTGGAVQQVIANTERMIKDKQETLRYIQSVLHSREYEAKIMKAMPFVMLLYLQLFMPGFLNPLYHNGTGICVMSAVLVLYAGLCYLANRATKVSV